MANFFMSSAKGTFASSFIGRIAVPAVMTLGLAFAGCGEKGAEGGGGSGDSKYDFSGATLKAVEIDVEGQKIAVSLPDNMVAEKDSPLIKYIPNAGPQFGVPSFRFSLEKYNAPKSAEELKLSLDTAANKMIVTKREAVAGGFLAAGHNERKGTVEVVFAKVREDGKAVTCTGSQARSEGVPNFDKTMAMLEKACTSMELK